MTTRVMEKKELIHKMDKQSGIVEETADLVIRGIYEGHDRWLDR